MTNIGGVYLVLNNAISPPKKKLSVCVCSKENWFFLINSQNRKIYDCLVIVSDDAPVMALPDFSQGYVAQGKKGCADKPLR